jgi:myo-inositol-1(or 4)-monophosphatase
MYGQRLNRIDKGAGDFATAADVEAEKTILGVIRTARPDDAVLGEEGGHQGAADAVRQWLVDPLCGTLNYAVGNMLAAVNVALRDGAAAVAHPFSGEVFFTDGETACVRHDGADDALLTPTPATRLVDVNLDPPFPSAPGFRAVYLLAHPSSNVSGRASYPRRWRWPGWLPAGAPRMSPMAATSPEACISRPASAETGHRRQVVVGQ